MSGVRMKPGATQFVRMPSLAHSQARLLVSWFSAPASEMHTIEDPQYNLI